MGVVKSFVLAAPDVLERHSLKFTQNWVQPLDPDTEKKTGQGSKHFPKWVNIWQPKWNEFGDLSILGHIFRAFVKCFKMKQEVGKFMALAPTRLPSLSQERHEDGDKTVCQQSDFCQWVGSIAATWLNVFRKTVYALRSVNLSLRATPWRKSCVMFSATLEVFCVLMSKQIPQKNHRKGPKSTVSVMDNLWWCH